MQFWENWLLLSLHISFPLLGLKSPLCVLSILSPITACPRQNTKVVEVAFMGTPFSSRDSFFLVTLLGWSVKKKNCISVVRPFISLKNSHLGSYSLQRNTGQADNISHLHYSNACNSDFQYYTGYVSLTVWQWKSSPLSTQSTQYWSWLNPATPNPLLNGEVAKWWVAKSTHPK